MSHKWIASLLCAEQTGTQVKVLFLAGLEAEGLLADLEWRLKAVARSERLRVAQQHARLVVLGVPLIDGHHPSDHVAGS